MFRTSISSRRAEISVKDILCDRSLFTLQRLRRGVGGALLGQPGTISDRQRFYHVLAAYGWFDGPHRSGRRSGRKAAMGRSLLIGIKGEGVSRYHPLTQGAGHTNLDATFSKSIASPAHPTPFSRPCLAAGFRAKARVGAFVERDFVAAPPATPTASVRPDQTHDTQRAGFAGLGVGFAPDLVTDDHAVVVEIEMNSAWIRGTHCFYPFYFEGQRRVKTLISRALAGLAGIQSLRPQLVRHLLGLCRYRIPLSPLAPRRRIVNR